jgi:hypothetical protein
MTVVYEDEYLTITYHEDLDLIETAARIKDEADLRRHLLKVLEVMKQCKPDKLLVDMHEFKLAYDPDSERWIDENIHAKQVELGIVKKAFVMSSDFNIQIGVEEIMDNEYARQIETAYFLTRERAMDWLKETG